MENFKTVSIREKNYKFIDDFAYIHNISKAEALNRIINFYRDSEKKKELDKMTKRLKEV